MGHRRWLLLCLLFFFCGCEPAWTFAVFGDASPAAASVLISPQLNHLIDAVNKTDAELALFTGDLVYGRTSMLEKTEGQYTTAAAALARLKSRLFIVPGNHDLDSAGGPEEYARNFGKVPWIMTHRGWTFIGLSTEEPGTRGAVTGAQLEWLKSQLSRRSKKSRTILIMHRPVWPTLSPDHPAHSLPQPQLHRLLADAGVTAVFSGHEHHFHSETRDGILYVISGGGGSELLPDGSHHFVLARVKGSHLSITPQNVY